MKKVLVALVAVIALTACKKDWECVCGKGEENSYTIYNRTKRDARRQCEEKVSIGLISVSSGNNCGLKK